MKRYNKTNRYFFKKKYFKINENNLIEVEEGNFNFNIVVKQLKKKKTSKYLHYVLVWCLKFENGEILKWRIHNFKIKKEIEKEFNKEILKYVLHPIDREITNLSNDDGRIKYFFGTDKLYKSNLIVGDFFSRKNFREEWENLEFWELNTHSCYINSKYREAYEKWFKEKIEAKGYKYLGGTTFYIPGDDMPMLGGLYDDWLLV